MAKLTLSSASIQSFVNNPTGPVMRHVSKLASQTAIRAADILSSSIQHSDPIRSSIRIQQDSDARGSFYRVVALHPAAMAVEEGTPPHIIMARGAQAMVFHWDRIGRKTIVPRRGGFRTHTDRDGNLWVGKGYVNHPGTRPIHFLSQALAETVQGGV